MNSRKDISKFCHVNICRRYNQKKLNVCRGCKPPTLYTYLYSQVGSKSHVMSLNIMTKIQNVFISFQIDLKISIVCKDEVTYIVLWQCRASPSIAQCCASISSHMLSAFCSLSQNKRLSCKLQLQMLKSLLSIYFCFSQYLACVGTFNIVYKLLAT